MGNIVSPWRYDEARRNITKRATGRYCDLDYCPIWLQPRCIAAGFRATLAA
jgi:hypothetical protein